MQGMLECCSWKHSPVWEMLEYWSRWRGMLECCSWKKSPVQGMLLTQQMHSHLMKM